jgi:two-component system, chemotaxis family, response regulator Rcp1
MSEQQERVEFEDAGQNYNSVLESIKQNMDPENNTALLIDDERGIRKMVARSLKDFAPNLQVYEAGNGKEGLDELAKIRKTHTRDPLLIVLDLNMPVMNGWDFIVELKKDYEAAGKNFGIPIIVLSSTSGEKGALFMKKSVHGGKSGYTPLATVAKESCIDKTRYDANEGKGLDAWLKYFLIPH